MARQPSTLNVLTKDLRLRVAYDGTDTVVHATHKVTVEGKPGGEYTVTGKARRRKGDARDDELGLALATARVFQQLADREMNFADAALED